MRPILRSGVGTLALVAACGGKTSDGTSAGGSSSGGGTAASGVDSGPGAAPVAEVCSNGPTYAGGTSFPFTREPTTNLPQCLLHCGADVDLARAHPTSAALPSGACASEGEACQLATEYLCACAPGQRSQGPYSNFLCRCAAGQWQCAVAAQGMSICTCDGALPDAG